ncbi:YczE/YyaS/YitT family protein [Clostridium thermarum]|uniref:YczE/YyaS/YitT family protein n=1 Tax=Clostridium thermarum TaxID=1716543 RepID=UPI0013D71FE8|nr:DUF6198 family protein [Clostridium thermarum]
MKHIVRFALYFSGLFILALGINLAIKSDLGVSPISSFPLSISIASGITLGTVTMSVYALFLLAQILILRRKFRPKNLLQLLFITVFGYFVDFAATLLTWLQPSNYFTQVLLMAIGILTVSTGVVFFVTMDIVPNAPEGLILAICTKTGASFSKIKVIFDCTSVILAAIISLVSIGNISTIREGTIISALVSGKLFAIISKYLGSWLKKVAFYENENPADVIQHS